MKKWNRNESFYEFIIQTEVKKVLSPRLFVPVKKYPKTYSDSNLDSYLFALNELGSESFWLHF